MKYPLVIVEWEDSTIPPTAWDSIESLAAWTPCVCRSVGYLVKNDRSGVVLVANIVDNDTEIPESGCNYFVIPKGCVTSIKLLDEGAELKSAFKHVVSELQEGANLDVPLFLKRN